VCVCVFFVFSYDTMIYHLLRVCRFDKLGQTRTASKVRTTRKDCHRSEMFLDCKVPFNCLSSNIYFICYEWDRAICFSAEWIDPDSPTLVKSTYHPAGITKLGRQLKRLLYCSIESRRPQSQSPWKRNDGCDISLCNLFLCSLCRSSSFTCCLS
jgi:hypothetical protein